MARKLLFKPFDCMDGGSICSLEVASPTQLFCYENAPTKTINYLYIPRSEVLVQTFNSKYSLTFYTFFTLSPFQAM